MFDTGECERSILTDMTIDELIARRTISLMNDAIDCDREAVEKLVEARVECNDELAEHETIQTGDYHEPGKNSVGLLGILNGIVGVDEENWGCIAASYDSETKKLIRFTLLRKRKIVKRPMSVKCCVTE